LSTPYQQAQNGLAKRTIYTLNNMTGTMLLQSRLRTEYWGAILHVKNDESIISQNQEMSVMPYEQRWNTKPKNSCIHPFGFKDFALIPIFNRKGKFNLKSDCCIYVTLTLTTIRFKVITTS
jgi:hypothetical protein